MRKQFIFIILILLSVNIQAQKLRVFLNHTTFYTDKQEPFLEFSIYVDGKSVVYKPAQNNTYEAEIQITIDVFKTDSDSLIKKLNYILVSESYSDVLATKQDFADVKNVLLANGSYRLNFTFKDLNNNEKALSYTDFVNINYMKNAPAFSGIVLLQNLNDVDKAKHRLEMMQKLDDYYPENISELNFYAEYYNTDKITEKPVFLRAFIETFETSIPEKHLLKKQVSPAPVGGLAHQFNISDLPSGNYHLILEIIDSSERVLAANSAFFQRNNPKRDMVFQDYSEVLYANTFVDKINDSLLLREYILSTIPIATTVEQNFFYTNARKITVDQMKRFFYTFWVKRNSKNPEQAWMDYKNKVNYVQKEYGSKLIKGYQTDRGRIYLKYGPPNEIVSEIYDPNAYPYEMWFYYVMGDQKNVKFVFWCKDYISNNYEVLHSNARGEISDPAWLKKLSLKLNPYESAEDRSVESYFGGNAYDYWMQYK